MAIVTTALNASAMRVGMDSSVQNQSVVWTVMQREVIANGQGNADVVLAGQAKHARNAKSFQVAPTEPAQSL